MKSMSLCPLEDISPRYFMPGLDQSEDDREQDTGKTDADAGQVRFAEAVDREHEDAVDHQGQAGQQRSRLAEDCAQQDHRHQRYVFCLVLGVDGDHDGQLEAQRDERPGTLDPVVVHVYVGQQETSKDEQHAFEDTEQGPSGSSVLLGLEDEYAYCDQEQLTAQDRDHLLYPSLLRVHPLGDLLGVLREKFG